MSYLDTKDSNIFEQLKMLILQFVIIFHFEGIVFIGIQLQHRLSDHFNELQLILTEHFWVGEKVGNLCFP